jgi:O-methyltransferase
MFEYLLNLVATCESGDYAELGTYRGMTASLIWRRKNEDTSLLCFDTFEGFSDSDLQKESNFTVEARRGNFKNTSIDIVRNRIGAGTDTDLVIRKGFFPDSFTEDDRNRSFRFVHLDADLYEPIKAGLEIFWPRLVLGGVIAIHDYLSPQYPRCREAVDEFATAHGIVVIPWSDRLGTALLVKHHACSDAPGSQLD